MKARFVTTLKKETIALLKEESEKRVMPVNSLLEEMVREYFEKGSLLKK